MGILSGCGIFTATVGMKLLDPNIDLVRHDGRLYIIGSVLFLAGIQMLSIGLIGELQVRHHHTSQSPASYTIDRLVRLYPADQQRVLSESKKDNY